MTRRVLMVMLGTLLMVGATRDAVASAAADQMTQQIDRVAAVLADPALKAPGRERERTAAIRKLAEEIFDVGEMARRTLGPHWGDRTATERAEFVTLFGDVIERAYISRVAAYDGETITVLGDSVDGNQATVRTRVVTRQGTEIPVD